MTGRLHKIMDELERNEKKMRIARIKARCYCPHKSGDGGMTDLVVAHNEQAGNVYRCTICGAIIPTRAPEVEKVLAAIDTLTSPSTSDEVKINNAVETMKVAIEYMKLSIDEKKIQGL